MIIVGNSNQSTTNPLNANMSNAKNNNLPVQSVAPPPGITVDTASSSISTTRSSRPSQHESSRRRRTGGRPGNRGRQARHQDGRAAQEDTPQTEAANLHSSSSPGGTLAATTPASDLVNRNLPTNRGHHRGGNARSGGGGGGGSGKYRQRQQTSQLIDGMESLTGLDIDLAESIVPTSSSTGRDLDASKRRHPTNSRKVNLSHILNYKYERPNSRSNRYSGYTSTQRNSGSHYRDPGTNHKFSKQQFLQANCQFVVADGHDYTIHKVDPDWPVDWNCIEEVRFMQSASSETTCPICLEPPIAAKITRCGHIYCWTCMLHYLSLSDEKRRQCPICFEPVYKSDLRSVISHSFTNYSVEEEITMRLMIRKKGCVEAEHYNRCENPSTSPSLGYITPHENLDSHDWSRANLVIVDPRTVVAKIAQRERNELEFKLETDRDQPEVCFVEQALSDLEERVNRLLNNTPDLEQNKAKVKDVQGSIKYGLSPTQAFSSDAFKTYLFYQCSDGQHVYLNPFSTKVLCHEYGSLENCPLELRAKILQMDWISMNEAWRKRFRYLSHLPLTCEFRLIEIDFEKLDLVSAATYKTYEDQIKWREQEREKRRREERKRDKKIQVQQDRKIYGIQPSLKINLDSTDQFPSVSDERYLGLAQPRNQSRTDDSSDEDEFPNPIVQPVTASGNDEQEISVKADDTEQVSDVITNVATSFRDIQLQEEELEARQKSNKLSANQSAWNANKSSSSSSNQSSFAQLLVGAKSSQKQWSRSATSSRATQPVLSSSNQGTNPNPHRQRLTSGSDEGGEELRAPPFECTISDFIDMNIVSSKKKGKKKS